MRSFHETDTKVDKVGKPPICLTIVKAMACVQVAMFTGICGIPDGEGEMGADVPV